MTATWRDGALWHPGDVVRRRFLIGGAAAVAATAAGTSPLVRDLLQPAPDANEMLEFFDTLALLSRNPDGPPEPGWVRKWTGPVAVRVHGRAGPRQLAEINGILSRLSRWTGLAFGLVGRNGGAANRIDVHLRSHDEMVERHGEGGPLCEAATYGNGGRLHTGVIEVGDRFVDCLRHEFMHALGFDNHWTGPRATGDMPSTLALRDAPARADRYSQCDALAIRILYDRRLPPGLPRDAALPVAGRIVESLLAA